MAGYRNLRRLLYMSEEVVQSIKNCKPVVALESTLITHGLPKPTNFKVGNELEEVVRAEGCTPATIALLNGKIHVGLTSAQLKFLSECADPVKISRRDLSVNCVRGGNGGTTVSGTMMAAHMAGIRVFATGGTGGVHRQVEQSLDISADLEELSRTPVTVVSAGVKSILDIPKTLEYLETQGVPVVVYGDSVDFPGFFSSTSGFMAPCCSNSVAEIAKIIAMQDELGVEQGVLVACPIPDTHSIDRKYIDFIIEQALVSASESGVRGSKITPFLLDRLKNQTGGKTLDANIALLKNNAQIASRIAVEYSKLQEENYSTPSSNTVYFRGSSPQNNEPYHTTSNKPDVEDGCTHAGSLHAVCGGVARNHAQALALLGFKTRLISAVGSDLNAHYIIQNSKPLAEDCWAVIDGSSTANYVGIVEQGLVRYGIGDFAINDKISADMVKVYENAISESKMVVVDGNCPVETIRTACDIANNCRVPVWYEPTDACKMCRIFDAGRFESISYCSPNLLEFDRLLTLLHVKKPKNLLQLPISDMKEFISETSKQVFGHLSILLVTMGEKGVVGLHNSVQENMSVHSVSSPDIPDGLIASVSGGGDCFNVGVMCGVLQQVTWPHHLHIGKECAHQCLLSHNTVPNNFHINQ